MYVSYSKNVFRNIYVRRSDIAESHLPFRHSIHCRVLFPHPNVTRIFSHPFPLRRCRAPFYLSKGFIFLIDILIFASQQSFVTHFDQLSLLFNHAIIDTVINVYVKKLMVRAWFENLI